MPKILRPFDWQTTTRRPAFAVDREDNRGTLRLHVALADEYFATQLAAPVHFTSLLAQSEAGAPVSVRTADPLPDGKYVAYVTDDAKPGSVAVVQGFLVRDPYRDVVFPLKDAKSEGAFRRALMPEWLAPIPLEVSRDRSQPRRIHIVLPSLEKARLSGGPNTALALGHILAKRGIPVNFIATGTAIEPDPQVLLDHMALLTGIERVHAPITFVDGRDGQPPVTLSSRDVLVGTAWWTVQQFRHCLRELETPRFVYLIQDFEPALYGWSTYHALATETYALDHLPLYNHKFLYEYFQSNRIGAPGGGWFDPVLDARHFFFDEEARRSKTRTLLFYARPNIAVRNLYEIGNAALARLAGEGVLDQNWRLFSIGEAIGDRYLPDDMMVEQLPWMGFDDYAARMRSCDVMLSLMLSPHPSYPPLEAAASGAIAVTNHFANKTPAALASLSENILAVEPTIDGVAGGIRQAIARLGDVEARRRASRLSMPGDWTTALAGPVDLIVDHWRKHG